MPKARDPMRDEAFALYKGSNGKMPLKEIAAQLGKGEGTVRGWKNKDKWNEKMIGTFQSNERNAPIERSKKKPAKKQVEQVIETFENMSEETAHLSDVQRFFCLYYIKYLNATKAYQKAYSCTYETANVNGPRLLVDASIQAEVKRLKRERAESILLDKEDVLQRYMDIAGANIDDYIDYGTEDVEDYDEDGNPITYKRSFVHLKDSKTVDNSVVSEVRLGKDGVAIKLHDKLKALQFLARYTDLTDSNSRAKIELEKVQLELEKARLELAMLKGEDEDDPHEAARHYAEMLKAEASNIFDDENEAEVDLDVAQET